MSSENNVRAIERAIQILNCFTKGKSSFTLTEIAREIELSPSTTLRILTTLENCNYIYRNPSNLKYYLGYQLIRLSNISFSNIDVVTLARPFLEDLTERYKQSTGIYIMRGDQRICVDRVEGTSYLRSIVEIGTTLPLNRGASGKMLLAHAPDDVRNKILATDTLISEDSLKKVRQDGYAVSLGERQQGVFSVSAPIINAKGEIEAAIFISGAQNMFDDLYDQVVNAVKEAAEKISELIGYSYD